MTGRPDGTPPLRWVDVLETEWRALGGEPPGEPSPPVDPDERLRRLHARIHERGTTALCLSGGGIRSATFALGVLQGLAHIGALGRFDYLSTVSGGGYTGGWLTTWLQRDGPASRAVVLSDLDPASAATRPDGGEAPPVQHVRATCRYLAPSGGPLSADMWSVLGTMGRNLLLNWLVLVPLIAATLLLPRLYYAGISAIESGLADGPCLSAAEPSLWFLLVALGCFTSAASYAALNFAGMGGSWSQGRFLGLFLVPLVAGATAITLFWSAYPCNLDPAWTLTLSAVLPAAIWTVLGFRSRHRTGAQLYAARGPRTIVAALAAGSILGAGAYWFATYPFGFGDGEPLRELYAVAAVPIVLGLVLLAIAIFAGLASRCLDDAALEWWSRCSGWIGIAAVLWLAAAGLVFYAADLLDAALHQVDVALALERRTSAHIFVAIVPLLSSLAGLAARSAGPRSEAGWLSAALNRLALPLTILLFLSSVAWVDLRLVEWLEYHRTAGGVRCTGAFVGEDPACHPTGAGVGEVLMLGAAFAAFGLVMSGFIPSNRFSLHGMYRQRLIRTFLGASRRDRRPNAFTGFDTNDDVRLHELREVRPLHVINATLNAVSATHVGRHERQAESFTFTPLHVGNSAVGYRPASQYGSDGGGPATGLSLGMALAVSGAAASSSLGIYSSKARAFLLTLANARLGLWFGNPSSDTTWQQSDPPLGVGPLVRELLGLTTDRNPYVYLSDGGHYENLGLWEMVARRCRYIVVSDAGCDPEYRFDDLANAVRRIRLDLGIPIHFPPLPMTAEGQGRTNPHAVIGVIRYSVTDGPGAPDGTILYLKATLSGDEPIDVLNFSRADARFPHDPTSEQFFDEARFESYRTLGFHTVLSVAAGYDASEGIKGLCDAAALQAVGRSDETGPGMPRGVTVSPQRAEPAL